MTLPDIAKSTQADVPALSEVAEAAGLFPGEMLPEMIAPFLAGVPGGFWLSCHLDGTAVGLSYTVPEEMADGCWNMLALAVRPDLHGRGLGRALVAATEQELAEQGARLVIVDTSSGDGFAGARAFYEALGYEAEARIRDFWAAGDHKITFRKML